MNPDGTVAFYKNVIIGKAYGHKSPIFEKEIQYVVFRPYWDVTPSIQRNEIVPHIEKDPNYIAKHNFEVVTPKGEVVTDNQVSPEVLEGIRSLHLMVRQKPGETNSLGLVKIIFQMCIRDRGHAAPVLYAALAEAGVFPESRLMTLREFSSELEGHPTPHVPGVDAATGSLGQGLSVGSGLAIGARMDKSCLLYTSRCV